MDRSTHERFLTVNWSQTTVFHSLEWVNEHTESVHFYNKWSDEIELTDCNVVFISYEVQAVTASQKLKDTQISINLVILMCDMCKSFTDIYRHTDIHAQKRVFQWQNLIIYTPWYDLYLTTSYLWLYESNIIFKEVTVH